LLPILYELPEEMQKKEAWKAQATWGLVNPNLNVSVQESFLADEMLKAARKGAAALALFASQHLNVQVGIGLHTDGWVGANFWLSNVAPLLTLDELLELSEVAVAGIDGGGLDDLLGLAILGRQKGSRTWLLWSHAWAHRCVLELRKEIAPKLLD